LAVASVSFDVKEGEIFGLIGPGAGKQRFSGY
jgi:ABC-type multidrug transport system ATPase subunit